MVSKQRFAVWCLGMVFVFSLPGGVEAKYLNVNARSAILMDMSDGRILFEKNADSRIPPASITKILTLYLVFDAVRQGRIDLSEKIQISSRAAAATGSRMHVKAGQMVPLEELIKGMAVVSGNDACIAVAEYMSGSAEAFVRKMNQKAQELGMTNSYFVNPNGLPANGQYTTARDIARLSVAYLHRFQDSLEIHSMRSYTFNRITHNNANRLLGKCPGVDGIKTGFVCAAGYNISATAKRGNVRLLAVLLGAPSPGVRAAEAAKLIEAGFESQAPGGPELRVVEQGTSSDYAPGTGADTAGRHAVRSKIVKKIKVVKVPVTAKHVKAGESPKAAKASKSLKHAKTARQTGMTKAAAAAQPTVAVKLAQGSKKNEAVKQTAKNKSSEATKPAVVTKNAKTPSKPEAAKNAKTASKPDATKQAVSKTPKPPEAKQAAAVKTPSKDTGATSKSAEPKKTSTAHPSDKASRSDKQKLSTVPASKKNATSQKSRSQTQDSKANKG